MLSASRPWAQTSAVVTLSATGVITGLSFVPHAPAGLRSPAGMPIHLMALEQSAKAAPTADAMARQAIVNVAKHYLRLAQTRSPSEMEALIWSHDSTDHVDHGESCAAFASLTLHLGAHAAGKWSWVQGGTSYPWALHKWADPRVNANPASMGITSVQQDATAHGRWRPLGDGYTPEPGDWVVFNGHVEVVTEYAGGVLSTIGGDSVPNFSVNAHTYPGSFASTGVVGFVDNGHLTDAPAAHAAQPAPVQPAPAPAAQAPAPAPPAESPIPGPPTPPAAPPEPAAPSYPASIIPGLLAPPVPGVKSAPATPQPAPATPQPAPAPSRVSHQADVLPAIPHASPAQQAFIDAVAPGAIAAQHKYGVPASVTIAQAIDESGWGQSTLASQYHNLFGIKGAGPAGSVPLPTQEYQNGYMVNTTSPFRVYHNFAQSIADHGKLLATSGYYGNAMSFPHDPNSFARALTGVYATDPGYGTKLIRLMKHFDLYQYDAT